MSNSETQPIPVRSLAEWAKTKREDVVRAETEEEKTTPMPIISMRKVSAEARELNQQMGKLVPAVQKPPYRGRVLRRKPVAEVEPLELVGVEETLISDPIGQAKEAQERHPNLIIWYGQATREFWVIGLDNVLRSYRKHADMIQGLGETVRSAG